MEKSTSCSLEGCERAVSVGGWCRGHWQRVYRTGSPGSVDFRRPARSTPPICLVVDCEEPARAKGRCHSHYQRAYSGNDDEVTPLRRLKVSAPKLCAIEGCSDPSKSRGWCNRHYQHWHRTGHPGPADLPRYGLITVCSAEGCERPHRTKGYCDTHYRRWQRGLRTDSKSFLVIRERPQVTTYHAAHMRLRAWRGRANEQTCNCGDQAADWAYQHNDPDVLFDPRGYPYSLKYTECYEPMCRSCHNLLDRDLDEREARQIANP